MEDGVLTDAGIAQGQLTQADTMTADANRLLEEAAYLRGEAYTLAPELKPKVVKAKAAPKKAAPKKAADGTVKRGPGRPRKNATTQG